MSGHILLVMNLVLKNDISEQVISTLEYMTRTEEYAFNNPPNHPFFRDLTDGSPDWRSLLKKPLMPILRSSCLAESIFLKQKQPDGSNRYSLHFQIQTHEDESGPLSELVDWLFTITQTYGFVGYSADSFSIHPRPIYFYENRIERFDPYIFNPSTWEVMDEKELKKHYEEAVRLLWEGYERRLRQIKKGNLRIDK